MDSLNALSSASPGISITNNASSPSGFTAVDQNNLTFSKKITDDGKEYTITITFKRTDSSEQKEKFLKNFGENAVKVVQIAVKLGLGTTKTPSDSKPLRNHTITSMQFQLRDDGDISMKKTKTGVDGTSQEKVSGLKDITTPNKKVKHEGKNALLNEIKSVFTGNVTAHQPSQRDQINQNQLPFNDTVTDMFSPQRESPELASKPRPAQDPRELEVRTIDRVQNPEKIKSNSIARTDKPLTKEEFRAFIELHKDGVKDFILLRKNNNSSYVPDGVRKGRFENITKDNGPRIDLSEMFTDDAIEMNKFIKLYKSTDQFKLAEAETFIEKNKDEINQALRQLIGEYKNTPTNLKLDEMTKKYGFNPKMDTNKENLTEGISDPIKFVEIYKREKPQQTNQAQPQPLQSEVKSNSTSADKPATEEFSDFIKKHETEIRNYVRAQANSLNRGHEIPFYTNEIDKTKLKDVNSTNFDTVDLSTIIKDEKKFIEQFKTSLNYQRSEARNFIEIHRESINEALSKFKEDYNNPSYLEKNHENLTAVADLYGFHKSFTDIKVAIENPVLFVKAWTADKNKNGLNYELIK